MTAIINILNGTTTNSQDPVLPPCTPNQRYSDDLDSDRSPLLLHLKTTATSNLHHAKNIDDPKRKPIEKYQADLADLARNIPGGELLAGEQTANRQNPGPNPLLEIQRNPVCSEILPQHVEENTIHHHSDLFINVSV